MTTRAGQRKTKGSIKAQLNEIPEGLADRWETIVGIVGPLLKEKRDQIKKAIGERPYRGLPVKETELRARWVQIRHNTNSLVEVFQSNAKFKPDGQVLIPKALIKGMIEQEKRLREGGEE